MASEAFVLIVFMVEKILRRTLLQLMVSAGFTTEAALNMLKRMHGIESIKNNWKFYDPQGRNLSDIVHNRDWQVIAEAVEERNSLVHGVDHKQEAAYKGRILPLLDAIDGIRNSLGLAYGYSGWKGFKGRSSSALHADPKVTT